MSYEIMKRHLMSWRIQSHTLWVNRQPSIKYRHLSYLQLLHGHALFVSSSNVLCCNTRMLAHRPENTILRMKSLGCVEFCDIAVLHYTDTIV